jgi:hypothetical protein
MLKKILLVAASVMAGLSPWTSSAVLAAGVDFSADMVQSGPRGEMTSRLYSSQGRMRMEYNQSGRTVVQIMDPAKGVAYTLFPQQKTFMVRRGPPSSPSQGEGVPANPCAGMQGVTCRKLGVEKVNGRDAEKWEFSGQYQGKAVTTMTWYDVQRGNPVRRDNPDGSRTELRFLGMEKLNGRNTEKWQSVRVGSDGKTQESSQWFDTRLQTVIREEFPGGYVREMRNIKEGPQPGRLFTVPQGYHEQQARQYNRRGGGLTQRY